MTPKTQARRGFRRIRRVASITPSRARVRARVRVLRNRSFGSFGTLLALDLGQITGWALRTADGLITSGTVQFRPGRFEGGGMVFLRFRAWLQELARPPAGSVPCSSKRSAGISDRRGARLRRLPRPPDRLGRGTASCPTRASRRHDQAPPTGKGNAGKDDVIAAMRAKGFTPADDNEADALACWTGPSRIGSGSEACADGAANEHAAARRRRRARPRRSYGDPTDLFERVAVRWSQCWMPSHRRPGRAVPDRPQACTARRQPQIPRQPGRCRRLCRLLQEVTR